MSEFSNDIWSEHKMLDGPTLNFHSSWEEIIMNSFSMTTHNSADSTALKGIRLIIRSK